MGLEVGLARGRGNAGPFIGRGHTRALALCHYLLSSLLTDGMRVQDKVKELLADPGEWGQQGAAQCMGGAMPGSVLPSRPAGCCQVVCGVVTLCYLLIAPTPLPAVCSGGNGTA